MVLGAAKHWSTQFGLDYDLFHSLTSQHPWYLQEVSTGDQRVSYGNAFSSTQLLLTAQNGFWAALYSRLQCLLDSRLATWTTGQLVHNQPPGEAQQAQGHSCSP